MHLGVVVRPTTPGAAGFGDDALAGGDRQVVHRERDRGESAAASEVVPGNDRTGAGGVDQGRHHAAVEHAWVRREVVADVELERRLVAVPRRDAYAARLVERHPFLEVVAEELAQRGLVDFGEIDQVMHWRRPPW